MADSKLTLSQLLKYQTDRRLDIQCFDRLTGETDNGTILDFDGVIIRYYSDIYYFYESLRNQALEMYREEVQFIEDKTRQSFVKRSLFLNGTWGGLRRKDLTQEKRPPQGRGFLPRGGDIELSLTTNSKVPTLHSWVVTVNNEAHAEIVAKALRIRSETGNVSPVDWILLWRQSPYHVGV